MKLSLIGAKVSLSEFNENLFCVEIPHNRCFQPTIRPSNATQFQFFPLPVRILGYCGGFHLERRSNVSLVGDDDTHTMCHLLQSCFTKEEA